MVLMHVNQEESGVSLRISPYHGTAGTWHGLSEARIEAMMRGCDISEADIKQAIEALRRDGCVTVELPDQVRSSLP